VMFRSLGFGVALSFILGFSLVAIVLLVGTWVSSITFRKPETLPAGCLEQLKKWKESETITSVVVDLTKGQVKKLAEVVARLFGDVIQRHDWAIPSKTNSHHAFEEFLKYRGFFYYFSKPTFVHLD